MKGGGEPPSHWENIESFTFATLVPARQETVGNIGIAKLRDGPSRRVYEKAPFRCVVSLRFFEHPFISKVSSSNFSVLRVIIIIHVLS